MTEIKLADAFAEITPHVAVLHGQVHVVTAGTHVRWRTFDRAGALVLDGEQPAGYYPVTDGRACWYHEGARYRQWVGAVSAPILPHLDLTAGAVGNSPLAVSPSGILLHQDLGTGVYCGSVRVGDWRPTGILRAREDGSPIMDDDSRRLWPYATGLCDEHKGVRVSEGESGIEGEVDGIRYTLWPGRDTRRPRVAVDGDLVAITAYGQHGCWLWIGTRAELAALGVSQPPVTLPPLGRPIDVGYFYRDTSAIQYGGDNPNAPCTVSVIIDPLGLPAEPFEGRPVKVIVDAACLFEMARHPEWWPLWVGTYLAAEGDEALLERMAETVRAMSLSLGLPRRPLVSYTAGVVFPDALSLTDIIGVQAYAQASESHDTIRERVAAQLQRVRHRHVALIAQAYDRADPTWTGARIAALQPLWWALCQDWPCIQYVLLFSDGRRGGTRDYPEVRPWHAEMVRHARTSGSTPVPTPVPAPTPTPTPTPGPPPARGAIGASLYTAIPDPRLDPVEFAHRLRDAGCTHTRAWLVSAWSVGPNGPGQVDGYMPWIRDDDGRFDLESVSQIYLDRLRACVEAWNESGIVPTLTGWELYTWSDRKQGMLWVPDANLGPFRRNRQGLVYGDDTAFDVIGRTDGPHAFLGEFYRDVVDALRGLAYEVEIGNEMPEKPMHERLRDAWRRTGYAGQIQVSRNTDAPGQIANMAIGRDYDLIAFHGKKTLSYLGERFENEPIYKTFRQLYESNTFNPKWITLSSDGCRKSTNVEDAYAYDALGEVFQDALSRGFSIEHQGAWKLRSFRDGRIDLDDINYDLPMLRSLQ